MMAYKLTKIQIFQLTLYLMYGIVNCMNDFTFWSPDGEKDLWCPNNMNCFNRGSIIETDHCCACDAIPKWELPGTKQINSLYVEPTDIYGKQSKLFSRNFNANYPSHFTHIGGYLAEFPENACDFNIVKIDVSSNIFVEIGNISCFTELDTLIMKRNKISHVSNKTFVGMHKLRTVDLSYNLIKTLDYDLFGGIHILNFKFDGNLFRKLDVSNVFIPNKTICGGSYSNNKHSLDFTNIGNFLLGKHQNYLCGNYDFQNVSVTLHPLLALGQLIDKRMINDYMPCGTGRFEGSAYDCDCHVAELFTLDISSFVRLYVKHIDESHCRSPESLENMSIQDVYYNDSLRDQMTCDIINGCPKNGNCKCQCTSQPNQDILIVDCSNQSCTDFPEVVPDTNRPIVLNMSYNDIKIANTRHSYFKKTKVLDMKENPIEVMNGNIYILQEATKIILEDHMLKDLPRRIQLLDPNIFRFGTNGIPCTCDNRWVGDWRKYKRASRQYPLFCMNYFNTYFEDLVGNFPLCDKKTTYYWMFSISGPLVLFSLLILLYNFFRFDFLIIKRRFVKKTENAWNTDVYISFDEENKEVRLFVLLNLEPFFRKKKISTYIPCRDALPGETEEDNVITNMMKCKYVLVIQSNNIYNSDQLHANSRRLEYKLAWHYFLKQTIEKLFVINFDNDKPEKFQLSKTRALYRFGMGFIIHNRKVSFYDKLQDIVNEPLVVNSKHNIQRKNRIRAGLWNKQFQK